MKRIFNFKKGQFWDGDEPIYHFLEEKLLEELEGNFGKFPSIKKDTKVTIIIEQ